MIRASILPVGLRAFTLFSVVAIFVCGMGVTTEALGQKTPKDTRSERGNTPTPPHRPKPRPPAPAPSKPSASVESGQFLDLGNRFREQKKWKAAEAAYKEAVTVWPNNGDALQKLGFLYLDRNKIDEAEQTYNKLRSVNATYASNLLAEINGRKASLAH